MTSYQDMRLRMSFNFDVSVDPTVFAYPYGSQNNSLTSYMALHGMSGIFLLEPGIIGNHMANSLRQIPRFMVTNSSVKALQKCLEAKA